MLAYLSFLAAVVSVQKLVRQSRRWGRSCDSRPPCIYELDGASGRDKNYKNRRVKKQYKRIFFIGVLEYV